MHTFKIAASVGVIAFGLFVLLYYPLLKASRVFRLWLQVLRSRESVRLAREFNIGMLEGLIEDYLEWAEKLEEQSGFNDQLESLKTELEVAISAARVALADESKTQEIWVLRIVFERLKTAGLNIARVLPYGASHEYDCLA